jgi:electron transfer flavoprotein beta subunit
MACDACAGKEKGPSVKILVCCKAVPGATSNITIAPDGKGLLHESQFQAINECDESALEEAIALKRQYGGEVTALTIGPLTTQEILYLALAKGADQAVRVDAKVGNPHSTGVVLAAALKTLASDLILTGTQSRDTLAGSVGIMAAVRLGLPFAYAVTKVEMEGDGVKVRKELGGGRFADVKLPLPALLCVQTGVQPLSFVPPARLLRARQQRPKSLSLTDIGLTEAQTVADGYRISKVFPPVRGSRVQFMQGSAPEIAAALMTKIREAL